MTDGEQRAALALVRALGASGRRVYVCSARPRSLAGASRHARGEARVADPLVDPDRFADDVARLVRQWSVSVLVPVGEASLLALLHPRAREPIPARLPFVDLETFRRISDKALVTSVAPRFGIATPEQRVLRTLADRGRIAADPPRFPVVIKPARSVSEGGVARAKYTVHYAEDAPSLARVLDELDSRAYPLLLQQRIVGPGVGIFLLLWEGRIVARFAHRRLREKPPSGGVSVYRESIPAPPELVDRSRALLDHFGWRGVAMVEYKLEDATGTPYLMEVNGRFWGSLQLALDAGVDFPSLLLDASAGREVVPVERYREGVRSRWWWGDVDQLLVRLRRSRRALALPPGAPGRWAGVRDFLMLWRPGDRSEILRLRDPWPFFRESIDWVRGR